MRMRRPFHPSRPFRPVLSATSFFSFFSFTPVSSDPSGRRRLALGTALAVLALSAGPALAQTGTTPGSTGSTSSYGGSSSSSGASGAAPAAAMASVTREDRELMTELAHAHIAAIDAGKLALEKTQTERVRKFAQQMIDEHGMALRDLQQLAQSKTVRLPQESDLGHKALSTALRLLSGDTFDKQYLLRAGVNDHERTAELLQKTQKNAKDVELRSYASRQLPVVQEQLTMARQASDQKTSAQVGAN